MAGVPGRRPGLYARGPLSSRRRRSHRRRLGRAPPLRRPPLRRRWPASRRHGARVRASRPRRGGGVARDPPRRPRLRRERRAVRRSRRRRPHHHHHHHHHHHTAAAAAPAAPAQSWTRSRRPRRACAESFVHCARPLCPRNAALRVTVLSPSERERERKRQRENGGQKRQHPKLETQSSTAAADAAASGRDPASWAACTSHARPGPAETAATLDPPPEGHPGASKGNQQIIQLRMKSQNCYTDCSGPAAGRAVLTGEREREKERERGRERGRERMLPCPSRLFRGRPGRPSEGIVIAGRPESGRLRCSTAESTGRERQRAVRIRTGERERREEGRERGR